MATSLLALLDDVTTILDDVSILTKIAAKKTAGVLGDDLALNAQQVSGVKADRELPVVWAVAKGSFVNKAILVPGALAISAFVPWLVTPLLMVGGAFLCYEGAEKIAHKLLPHDDGAAAAATKPAAETAPDGADLVVLERDKIKGAIRTDFVLSAEIIAITLGTVEKAPFVEQVIVLVGIAILMTVGVYGFVAGIVKLDDAGLALSRRDGAFARATGRAILAAAPWLMRLLSIAGTAAMFLVGGGILSHGVPPLHHAIEAIAAQTGALRVVVPTLLDGVVGVVAGLVVLAVVTLAKKLFAKDRAPA